MNDKQFRVIRGLLVTVVILLGFITGLLLAFAWQCFKCPADRRRYLFTHAKRFACWRPNSIFAGHSCRNVTPNHFWSRGIACPKDSP
jgi:hypothetical protein